MYKDLLYKNFALRIENVNVITTIYLFTYRKGEVCVRFNSVVLNTILVFVDTTSRITLGDGRSTLYRMSISGFYLLAPYGTNSGVDLSFLTLLCGAAIGYGIRYWGTYTTYNDLRLPILDSSARWGGSIGRWVPSLDLWLPVA